MVRVDSPMDGTGCFGIEDELDSSSGSGACLCPAVSDVSFPAPLPYCRGEQPITRLNAVLKALSDS